MFRITCYSVTSSSVHVYFLSRESIIKILILYLSSPTVNYQGNSISSENPVVMGILNATPDSFYNKGRESSLDEIMIHAMSMIAEGAAILDIGGQSSRPNAGIISTEEELQRVLPVIKAIHNKFPSTILSIDTYRSEVAEKSIDAGVTIINDISGGEMDKHIIDIAIKYKATYICMHMQGTPQTMQQQPHYKNICKELYEYFSHKIITLQEKGLDDILIDVGFGFGKTLEHNYELLNHLSSFLPLQKPIVAGISRKSMVYKPLHSNAENALNGTTALHMIALQNCASVLRVHDVKEAMECILLHKKLQEIRSTNS